MRIHTTVLPETATPRDVKHALVAAAALGLNAQAYARGDWLTPSGDIVFCGSGLPICRITSRSMYVAADGVECRLVESVPGFNVNAIHVVLSTD